MLRKLFLAAALIGLSSCSLTPPESGALGPRFREGDAANLVVRFYGWNSIQITRPDTRENGFLPLLDRQGVAARLAHLPTRQSLAVVVLGSMFSKAQEQEIIRQWHEILDARGFQRLVLLRAGFRDEINGLRVVYDSAMNRADASSPPAQTARGITQITPALGADAANSSGVAIQ